MIIEQHVYFVIFGFDHDPEDITRRTGMRPSETWRRGESFSETFPEARRRDNCWILASGLDDQASHREHFEALMAHLDALGAHLPALLREYRCGIGVSRYYFMEDPAFYLPETLLERYRQLGLPVTFDQMGLDSGAQ